MMEQERGVLARLLGDPVRVRRPASVAGLILAALSGASYLLLGAGWLALLYGLTWLALPFAAGVLGYGKAFFVQHGVGARRALVETILGLLGAILSCVLLALFDADDGWLERLSVAGLAALLYLAAFRGLAGGVALALGRGLDYAGQRILELDDEGW